MWINKTTGKVCPLHTDIRQDCPHVSFPSTLSDAMIAEQGYDQIKLTTWAFDPAVEKVLELPPAVIAGVWTQQWETVALTPAELAQKAAALQSQIVAATQSRLDTFAQTRNYDGILSACTYATSSIPKFAAEGQAAVNARDATWSALYALLSEVQAGTRPMPASFADVEPLLPVLAWPA